MGLAFDYAVLAPMTIIWMAMRERPDKKYDNEKLREAKLPLKKVLPEIVVAVGKLKYEIFHIRENSISLMKRDAKESNDIFLMTVVGEPEEIRTIQLDERVTRFFK